MTCHLTAEREVEFVETLHGALELIGNMIEETGGRWGSNNGTNSYLRDVHEKMYGVYAEAVTHLGLLAEHERLERAERDRLFKV
ncbi:hypothetical protein, partial [Clavibacter michiganensis]|uniref:hypothetical protein n=1 Tax=Clavibacter michiganensis TaxID=28447 RepID=UPI001365F917